LFLGFPLAQIKSGKLEGAEEIFDKCIAILRRLAECGLVHCDFNEFNLMINHDRDITLIDFPQMVSTSHPNAGELLERDINCLVKFFAMKMKFIPSDDALFTLEELNLNEIRIDEEVRAAGFQDAEDDDDDIMGFDLTRRNENEEENEEVEEREEEQVEEKLNQKMTQLSVKDKSKETVAPQADGNSSEEVEEEEENQNENQETATGVEGGEKSEEKSHEEFIKEKLAAAREKLKR
jgi:RIO kinase 2